VIRYGCCIRITDKRLTPAVHKRFVCIEPSYLWFFRINSKSVWEPNHLLRYDECGPVLEWDSYAELASIVPIPDAAHRLESGDFDELGKFPELVMLDLLRAASIAKTLTGREKRILKERLKMESC